MDTIIMDLDDWLDDYRPVPNHITGDEYADHFETYGEELEYVLSVLATDPERVWTYQDDDNGIPCVTSGFHLVNRIGYYITEKPNDTGAAIYVDFGRDDSEFVNLDHCIASDTQSDANTTA